MSPTQRLHRRATVPTSAARHFWAAEVACLRSPSPGADLLALPGPSVRRLERRAASEQAGDRPWAIAETEDGVISAARRRDSAGLHQWAPRFCTARSWSASRTEPSQPSAITGTAAAGGHEVRRPTSRQRVSELTESRRELRCQCHSGFRTDTRFHS